MKETKSIDERNDSSIDPIRYHDMWKGIEFLQWNASSTGENTNGIKKPNINDPNTINWQFKMSNVRYIMESLFDYAFSDENHTPKKSITNWIWENKIEPDIKLEGVRSVLKWVRDTKPPIELYRHYYEAMDFQERISIFHQKTNLEAN